MRTFVPSLRLVRLVGWFAAGLGLALLVWVVLHQVHLDDENDALTHRLDVSQADQRAMKVTQGAQAEALAEANRRLRSAGRKPVTAPITPTVAAGVDGQPGLPGQRGDQGLAGPRGPGGKDGVDGKPGSVGKTGVPGATGAAGVDGSNGADGLPGPKGDTGDRGPAGTDGKDGSDGEDGPPGPTGAPGADSTVPGPTGPAGPAGYPDSFTYTTGAPGPEVTFVCTDPDGDHAYTCQPA